MTKREIVIHLYKAIQLLRQVEESMAADHQDVDEQYHTDIGQARDICADLATHLNDIINVRGK